MKGQSRLTVPAKYRCINGHRLSVQDGRAAVVPPACPHCHARVVVSQERRGDFGRRGDGVVEAPAASRPGVMHDWCASAGRGRRARAGQRLPHGQPPTYCSRPGGGSNALPQVP